MVRWLFLFSASFSILLFFSFFILFHGFLPEGLPSGVYFSGRDVSGFTYKNLEELAMKMATRGFEKTVCLKMEGQKKIFFDFHQEIPVVLDTRKLISEYRRLKEIQNPFAKIYHFVFPDTRKFYFANVFEINAKESLRQIELGMQIQDDIHYKIEDGNLKKTSTRLKENNILDFLNQCLHSPLSFCEIPVHADFVESSTAGGFEYKVFEENLSWEEFDPVSVSILETFPTTEMQITLNPGDVFSFQEFWSRQKILNSTTTITEVGVNSTQIQTDFEELVWKGRADFILASWLYKQACRFGFSVIKRSKMPYYLPGNTGIMPGFEARIDNNSDLILRNGLNRPFLFQVILGRFFFSVCVKSCTEEILPTLEEVSRKQIYPGMQPVVDDTLSEAQTQIERKPLSGLQIFGKSVKELNGKKLIVATWSQRYRSRLGIVRVSSKGINLFDPQSWKDLGIEDGFMPNTE